MSILVAGSRGFIGSHLVNYFRKRNFVIACDIHAREQDNNYRHIQSIADYEKILGENQFDLFINASGSAGVGFSIAHPAKDHELNTSNVEAMLTAIRKYSPQTRFINFSSAAVYGNPKQLPVSEKDEPAPLSPYGKHKLEAERILTRFHEQSELKTCSLRVFSAYGPRLHKQLFWELFLKTRETKKIHLFGTGNESRDFIFIDDLVRALEIITQKGSFTGDCINVSSGTETMIRQAANLFLQKLGGGFELVFSGEEKQGDPRNWRADISRLESLGFVSSVDMEAGLSRVAESYLQEHRIYGKR